MSDEQRIEDLSEDEKLEAYHIRTAFFEINVRGKILYYASKIETTINTFLSFYFCDNASVQDEFIEQFLNTNKMFYADKLNLLEFILNKHFPSFNERYNKNIKNVAHSPKKLKNRMDAFMALRNVIAHRVVDISKDVLLQSKGLYIIFVKDEGVVIDKAKIQYYQDEFNYIINALQDLVNNDMVDFIANRNKNPK